MTNEEIINAFPECEHIKKIHVSECINRVFDDVKFYREVDSYIRRYCFKFWPEPTNYLSDEAKEHTRYFYGDYNKRDFRFPEWLKQVGQEFVQRNGPHRTCDEACQLAADKWVEMIFGTHIQDNGDRTGYSDMAMMLGTLAKEEAMDRCGDSVPDKARELLYQYYLGGCIYKSDSGHEIESVPYSDYGPNSPLYDILVKAGVDEKDALGITPWKTGIVVDYRDNSVIIRGYQKEMYL